MENEQFAPRNFCYCVSQAGSIMGSLIILLVGNEGQQCRLVTSTQSNPGWGTKRSVKVGQVPHFLRVEEEQTVEGVIPPSARH